MDNKQYFCELMSMYYSRKLSDMELDEYKCVWMKEVKYWKPALQRLRDQAKERKDGWVKLPLPWVLRKEMNEVHDEHLKRMTGDGVCIRCANKGRVFLYRRHDPKPDGRIWEYVKQPGDYDRKDLIVDFHYCSCPAGKRRFFRHKRKDNWENVKRLNASGYAFSMTYNPWPSPVNRGLKLLP